jgi:hypothetical protein
VLTSRIQQHRAEQQERKHKAREMRQQAEELTQAANDNDLTDEYAIILERYRQRQRDRDGLDY